MPSGVSVVARPVSLAVPAAPAPGRRRAPQRSSGDANKCLTVVSGGQGWMASATDGGDGGDERQSPHLGPSMEAAEPACGKPTIAAAEVDVRLSLGGSRMAAA
jgi:hypothetical protein